MISASIKKMTATAIAFCISCMAMSQPAVANSAESGTGEQKLSASAVEAANVKYNLKTQGIEGAEIFKDDASGEKAAEWMGELSASDDDGKSVYKITAAEGTSTAATVGLNGISDYTVSSKLRMNDVKNNFGGGLIFRYTDNLNYVMYRFSGTSSSDKKLEILKFENGQKAELASLPYEFDTNTYYDFKVNVIGSTVTAYLNGSVMFEGINIGNALTNGDVGLRAYEGTMSMDEIDISGVSDTAYITDGYVSDGEVTANVFSNKDEKNVFAVAALYDNGELEAIDTTNVDLLKNTSSKIQFNISLPQDLEGVTLKVMAFDGPEKLQPMCKYAVCDFTNTEPTPTASPTSTPVPSYSPDAETVHGSTTADFLTKTYSSDEFSHGLDYRLYVPMSYDSTKQYPLIVYLNGAGSRGSDNVKQLSNLAPMLNPIITNEEEYPCIIAVPQCPNDEQWVDTPWSSGSYNQDTIAISDELAMVNGMIDELSKTYNIDQNRLYVSGQSMGGYGSWDLITRYPDKFAAAVINCGAGDPNKAGKISDMPIMVLHGNGDDTVPVSGSRDMVNALKSSGSDVLYYEYDGTDHYVQRRMFENPSLWLNWLMSQTKDKTKEFKFAPYGEYDLKALEQFNSQVPSNWKSNQSGSWSISGNMIKGTTASQSSAAIYDSDTMSLKDYTASVYMKMSDNSNGGAGLVVRYVNDSTLITVRFTKGSTSKLQVAELQAGTSAIMKDFPFEWDYNTLYNLKVSVRGDTLNAYIDNVRVIKDYKINRETLKNNGGAGLRIYDGTFYADDFAVYTDKPVSISTPVHDSISLSPYVPLSGMTANATQAFDLYIDGEKAEITSDSDCVWNYRTTKLENGKHTVTVKDKGGSDVVDEHIINVLNTKDTQITDYSLSFTEITGTAVNFTDSEINGSIKAEYIVDGTVKGEKSESINLPALSDAAFSIPIDWDVSKGSIKIYVMNKEGDIISHTIEMPKKNIVLDVNDFENYQVLQRDLGTEQKQTEISGTYDGLAADIQVQVVNYDDNSVVVPWTDLPVNNSEFRGVISIPQGGWYKLYVRAVNGGEAVKEISTGNKFGVGVNILCIGQSNMVGTGALASNTSANTDGRKEYTAANDLAGNYKNGHWQHLKDPYDVGGNGSMVPSLANELTEKYGIPFGFIPAAASGSGLAVDPNNAWPNWITRFDDDHYKYDNRNIYGRSITRAKEAGGIELIIMNQGEHDVSMGTEESEYERMLKQIYDYYDEDVYKNIPLFIGQLGASGSTIAAYEGKDEIMTGIRRAQSRCDDGSNIFLATTEMDLSKNKDEIHYTITSLDVLGKRMANSIMYYWGDSSYYRGPYISGASYSDSKKVIDVKITHRGGTDFTPNAGITGFTVYDNGTEVKVVSAEKVNSDTIRLTLDNSVTGNGTLRYLYGKNPDISGIIKDNTPLALPLECTVDDIIIK